MQIRKEGEFRQCSLSARLCLWPTARPAPVSKPTQVIVLGAGVVGAATAYALARRGVSVTLIDRAGEPGRGTSYANGAQLSYAYTDALASPAMVARLPSLLAGLDPAFRLKPSLDPDFLRWGLSFLRNGTSARFQANTLAGLRLAIESRLAMHDLLDRHPMDFGHAMPGKLHVYDQGEGFAAARRLVELKRSAGAVQEALTPDEAIAIEPALGSARTRMVGAIYSPEEEVGDPYRFCGKLLEHLRRDYAVSVRFDTEVARIDLAGDGPAVVTGEGERLSAGHVVVCTGVDSPRLLKPLGVCPLIWPMKGYSLTVPPGPQSPRVSITDVTRKLVFCSLSGRVRIAGLADLGQRSTSVDPARLATLMSAAQQSLPEAADYGRPDSSWAGLRPMTPNSLPIIGQPRPGLAVNVGHGALGWTYAMGAAERTAMLMMDQGR